MRLASIFYVVVFVMLSSCGTTYVQYGDGNNNANIYKNEKLIGVGRAKIVRNGIPLNITLTAKDDAGNELGKVEARRKITLGTVVFAFLPYPTYVSLLFNLKFDRQITIPPNQQNKLPKSKWDDEDNVSVWD
ncbi:MAG: hypothetical protein EAY81_11480 [Bacteroidetes bacterium]|nr:MAG: hypothetical protein EAY81_11480 [Bacteroidota bacterium]